jgi:hypothetical protein
MVLVRRIETVSSENAALDTAMRKENKASAFAILTVAKGVKSPKLSRSSAISPPFNSGRESTRKPSASASRRSRLWQGRPAPIKLSWR